MSILGFLGGLSGAYSNYQAGADEAKKRRDADEDRAYVKQQREFQRSQQQRTLEEQKRTADLRTGLAAIKTTEDDPGDAESPASSGTPAPASAPALSPPAESAVQPDVAALSSLGKVATVQQGAPVDEPAAVESPAALAVPSSTAPPLAATPRQRLRRLDDIHRDQAEVYRKAGDMAGWLQNTASADTIAYGRATKKYQQFRAGLDGLDLDQAGAAAKVLFDNDAYPGEIRGVTRTPDGLAVQIHYRETGNTISRTFKNKAELADALEAHYSPETFAAFSKSKREAAIKAEEVRRTEAAKVHSLRPGEVLVNGAGSELAKNDNPYRDYDVDEDGKPIYIGPRGRAGGGAGGAGGGAKAGTKVRDEFTPYTEAMKNIVSQSETKFASPDEAATAEEFVHRIAANNDFKVPPALAATAALTVMRDRTKTKVGLDPSTGAPVSYFKTTNGGQLIIDKDGVDTSTLTPGQRTELGVGFLRSQRSPGAMFSGQGGDETFQQTLLAAAKDGSGVVRKSMEQSILAAANADIDRLAKANPGAKTEDVIRAKGLARQSVQARMDDIDRRIDVLRQWYPGARPAAPVRSRIAVPGGLRPTARGVEAATVDADAFGNDLKTMSRAELDAKYYGTPGALGALSGGQLNELNLARARAH
ncbi:MAG: hypothetical protein ABI574_00980 [Burkholderiales bacterium]